VADEETRCQIVERIPSTWGANRGVNDCSLDEGPGGGPNARDQDEKYMLEEQNLMCNYTQSQDSGLESKSARSRGQKCISYYY
jgi:hypothetical protein